MYLTASFVPVISCVHRRVMEINGRLRKFEPHHARISSVASALHTRAHQEMRHPNVTWRIILSVFTYLPYLPLNYDRSVLPKYSSISNAYLLHIKWTQVCEKRLAYPLSVFSKNYYVVYSLPIRKIYSLWNVFSAVFVLWTTKNSDNLKIRVPDGSRSL